MHIGAVAGSGGVPTETGGRPPHSSYKCACCSVGVSISWHMTLHADTLDPLSCLCLNSVAFKRLNQSTHRRSQLWALRIPSFDSHRNTPVQVSSSERIHKKTWQHELTVQAVKETEQIKDGNVCPYRSKKTLIFQHLSRHVISNILNNLLSSFYCVRFCPDYL